MTKLYFCASGIFLKKFGRNKSFLWDSFGFQSQTGQPYSRLAEVYLWDICSDLSHAHHLSARTKGEYFLP